MSCPPNVRLETVMDRALNLLKHDNTKFEQFRAKVSAFQRSSVTAANLIDSFFALFDTSAAELGKLIKELAEIYENETKRSELLKAWNDWRAINEDYPALPVSMESNSGSLSSLLGNGGTRVLRLKNSTVQSARSDVSRQRSWGSGASNSTPFPPISQGAATTASSSAKAKAPPVARWANSVAQSGTAASSSSSSRQSSRPRPTTQSTVSTTDAFPALPAAAKPSSSIFGYGTGAVRRDGGRGAGSNAWSNGGSSSGMNGMNASNGASETEQEGGEVDGKGKKKGKGNKKLTLYHFG